MKRIRTAESASKTSGQCLISPSPISLATNHRSGPLVRRSNGCTNQNYVDWLEAFCEDGGGRIEDTTTGANEVTFDASRIAAGAAIAAVREAIEEKETVSYALCRPSGHHAQPTCADGFCFLNNAAIAAEEALAYGMERVAIIDWDVHHGNGTQEAFYNRDDE